MLGPTQARERSVRQITWPISSSPRRPVSAPASRSHAFRVRGLGSWALRDSERRKHAPAGSHPSSRTPPSKPTLLHVGVRTAAGVCSWMATDGNRPEPVIRYFRIRAVTNGLSKNRPKQMEGLRGITPTDRHAIKATPIAGGCLRLYPLLTTGLTQAPTHAQEQPHHEGAESKHAQHSRLWHVCWRYSCARPVAICAGSASSNDPTTAFAGDPLDMRDRRPAPAIAICDER